MTKLVIEQTGPNEFIVTARPIPPNGSLDDHFETYHAARDYAEGVSLITHWRIEDRAADRAGKDLVQLIKDDLAERMRRPIIICPSEHLVVILYEIERLQRDNADLQTLLAMIEAPQGVA